ncbi:amino acid permease [Acidihalobacter yilgarnensis]|uniref:Amino acid permease n=1 Tax=Acidihalobacter yilgarnensis TaxID=2819280 RepID=A0A1D8IL06_9GAMM|nr:APC family permease [Acidihalobacter yilgarnensis]AOU97071.1 amino acid permease [Acidihalobacter yilgarnensis]
MTGTSPLRPAKLRQGELGLGYIVSATLANIAPAMSFYFGFAVIAVGAGVAAPLTILAAMVAVLFLANTLAEFSRFTPSAGSFVTFIGKSFGPTAAVTAAVFLIFGYILAGSAVVAIMGGWTAETIHRYLGINIPWEILTLAAIILVGTMTVRGVRLSTAWAAAAFWVELVVLVGVGIAILAVHGQLNLHPFEPHYLDGGLKGLGLGFPIAIFLFVGWENASMMAEESKEPRRLVPRALFTSAIAIGVLYTFLAYATEVGFGYDVKALNAAQVPYVDLATHLLGGIVVLLYLAGITSIFGSLIGLVNAQSRILFNSGREGLLPNVFGAVHAEHQTPWAAIATFLLIALALLFMFAGSKHPVVYFGEAATCGTIPVAITYGVTNLALPFYVWRKQRTAFSWLRHAVLPVLGFLAMILPVWGLITPGQPYPFNLYPYVALVVFVLAFLYARHVVNRDPRVGERIGSVVADEAK